MGKAKDHENITADAAIAFINNTPFTRSNTTVTVDDKEVSMLLHGNKIAWCKRSAGLTRPRSLRFDLCGWHTVTTRERINGLLHYYAFNISLVQRNWETVLMQTKFRFPHDIPTKAELKLATDIFNPSFVMKAFKIQKSMIDKYPEINLSDFELQVNARSLNCEAK